MIFSKFLGFVIFFCHFRETFPSSAKFNESPRWWTSCSLRPCALLRWITNMPCLQQMSWREEHAWPFWTPLQRDCACQGWWRLWPMLGRAKSPMKAVGTNEVLGPEHYGQSHCFSLCGIFWGILGDIHVWPRKYRRSATKRGFLKFLVCVCVNHLKRCKTSNLLFFLLYFCRGTVHVLCAMVQRSGRSTCGYHGWSPWRTCFKFHAKFLWWAMANPRTTMPFSNNLFSLCHLLHGFRNLSSWERYHFVEREGSAWKFTPFSTGYGDGNFYCFSGPFSDLLLSGLKGLFLHVRCIPQQNSQWQF